METGMGTITAFCIFGICGLVSVLLDLDHFIALVIWRYWNPKFANGRCLHTPILIIVSLLICLMVSYIGRLHLESLLGG